MQEIIQNQSKQKLFLELHPDVLSFLKELQIDSQITLTHRTQISSQNSLEKAVFHNIPVVLVIKKQFLLQYDVDTKEVISGIKFDYHFKYGIIENPPESKKAIGTAEGIEFQFPDQYSQKQITLFLTDKKNSGSQKQFRQFVSHLENKKIIQTKFHEKFKAVQLMGQGNTALVVQSLNIMTNQDLAVKSFKKQIYFSMDGGTGKKAFFKEFQILTHIQSCRYLIQLYGVYESQNSIYIAMQRLNCNLFCYLRKFGYQDAKESKIFMYQLLIGLRALHRRGIMHRDIKLENIMVRGFDRKSIEPVIVDFGLAEYETWEDSIYNRCGTPAYFAPEVINCKVGENQYSKYNSKCDIFSMGVIFHILLLGKSVFEGDNVVQVSEANQNCDIDYQFTQFANILQSIKDLLRKMLAKDPQNRATVEQLMLHPFFKEEEQMFRKQVLSLDSQIEKDNTYRAKLKTVEQKLQKNQVLKCSVKSSNKIVEEDYTEKMSVEAEKSLPNSKSVLFTNKGNTINESRENSKNKRDMSLQKKSDPNLLSETHKQKTLQCQNQIITEEKEEKIRSKSSDKLKNDKKLKSSTYLSEK